MRNIEFKMNEAILNNEDCWVKDNTKVVTVDDVNFVYLYNNLIAKIGDTWLQLFDGNHRTATTKSRLNALLSAHGSGGEFVFQRNGDWFLVDNGNVIPFVSGVILQ